MLEIAQEFPGNYIAASARISTDFAVNPLKGAVDLNA